MATLVFKHLILPAARAALTAVAAVLVLSEQGYLVQLAGVTMPQLIVPMIAFSALLLAADLTYWLGRGRGLRLVLRVTASSVAETETDPFRGRVATTLFKRLLRGSALLVLIYGLLAAAPEIFQALFTRFDIDPTAKPYVDAVHGIRGRVLGLITALMAAWALAPLNTDIERTRSGPFLQSLAFSAAALLAWSGGTDLSYLGDVYPLVGATIATGLFFVALTSLSRYAVSSGWSGVAEAAGWLAVSKSRGLGLGLSIAFYALLVRPLVYHHLVFAPLFEWIVVIWLATVVLLKANRRIRRSINASHEPAVSTRWNRHRQQIEELPDPYFRIVTNLQKGFIESGQIRGLWCYSMMVMLQNGAPLHMVADAVKPLVSHRDATGGWLLPGRQRRLEARRHARRDRVLAESLRKMEDALATRTEQLDAFDADALQSAGERYLATRDGLAFVIMLIAASWQNGASLPDSALRWFRLLSIADASFRWHHVPWQRRRIVQRNIERRRDLIVDSIEQALESDADKRPYLAFSTTTKTLRAEPLYRSKALGLVTPYAPMEVRGVEARGFYDVCTFDNQRGYVGAQGREIQPTPPWRFDNRY